MILLVLAVLLALLAVVMVVMMVMVVLLAPPTGLAAAAVFPIHVFVLAELARIGAAPLGSPVALPAAGLVRVLLSPVGLALAAPVATTVLLTAPVPAALPVPPLARLVALTALLGALHGPLVLGVAVSDLLVPVGVVVLLGPLRARPAGPVPAVRGVAGPVLPLGHLLVLVLLLAPATAPSALSVPCHGCLSGSIPRLAFP